MCMFAVCIKLIYNRGDFRTWTMLSTTVCLMATLPCMDAVPTSFFNFQVRGQPRGRALFFLVMSCLLFYEFVSREMETAKTERRHDVPKLTVHGFTQISALDILNKAVCHHEVSCRIVFNCSIEQVLTTAILSMHVCYRCFRFPTQAPTAQVLPSVMSWALSPPPIPLPPARPPLPMRVCACTHAHTQATLVQKAVLLTDLHSLHLLHVDSALTRLARHSRDSKQTIASVELALTE